MKKSKKLVALLLALVMVLGLSACFADSQPTDSPTGSPSSNPTVKPTVNPTESPAQEEYIPAPYTANSVDELTAAFLEPKFYENPNGGPTIGVTLLGVIKIGNMYFRDLNNNHKLDDFEDWRLDADTRAAAFAKAQSDHQLAYNVVNSPMYSSNTTVSADAVDENGKPVWNKVYNNGGSGGDVTAADIVKYWDEQGWRNFVVRNNPETEVAVWFNNGLEQYAEYDAIQKGEVAVPFLSFTNPISHGMPGSEGVTAAALGDGNADFVLTDSQYDRIIMWYKGIDGIYGPQIDLATDPRWTRNNDTYGEREDLAAEIARNLVMGYQNGDQGMVRGSVLLTVKHFPGDGAAYNGFESHGQAGRYRVYSTKNSLADYQLKAFIAAFEAGAAGIMPGYSQPIIDARIAEQSITYNGKTYDIRFEGRGNAFNEDILMKLAREILGFDGLINSDTLQSSSAQGVEDLTAYEETVAFINSGCEAGCFTPSNGRNSASAGETAKTASEYIAEALANGDIKRETLEKAAASRAKIRILSGDLDNPYRDLEESVKAINEVMPKVRALAEEINLKSVVLMKNSGSSLPLASGTKVYVQGFNQRDNANVSGLAEALKAEGLTIVDDYKDADVAYLYVSPSHVSQGSNQLAIMDLGEDMETPVFDNDAKPSGETASITTVANMKEFKKIADAIHQKGGKVIGQVDVDHAWILTNMEPYCDGLIGSVSGTGATSTSAIAKVVTGKHNPTGKLPLTMVADASVIALKTTTLADGSVWEICVSPNDVPGYVKDQYMDKAVLDASPSGSYAYKDANGNLYVSGFGLSYDGSGPSTPAGPSTPSGDAASTDLDFNSNVLDLEGTWTLSQVVAGGKTGNASANALTFKVTKELDPSELVDGPRYIHNQVYNFTGVLTFGVKSIVDELEADDIEFYKGTTSWEDFPQGEVVAEGQFYKQPGPATMRFKDIDDYGLYLAEIAGVGDGIDTTNKTLIIGLNANGQLLLGYSKEHIERPGTSGEWEYVLVFSK